MAAPLRPTLLPQCSACVRNYAFGGLSQAGIGAAGLGQQIRGKKKLAKNTSSAVPVRLLKNVKTYGKKGSIVPISMGRMRNEWFPRGVAEYVTQPELRTLKLSNTAMERDVEYGVTDIAAELSKANGTQENDEYADLRSGFTVRKAAEVEKVTPERSIQLLDIFVPKTLDFYRQPIPEEPKEAESEQVEDAFGRGAAAELFAARQKRDEKLKTREPAGIYGSVSTQDILAAVRAAMENNDESARVLITEADIKFVNAGSEVEESGRVKHVGSFSVEIMIKGAEAGLRRTVRVHAQEA